MFILNHAPSVEERKVVKMETIKMMLLYGFYFVCSVESVSMGDLTAVFKAIAKMITMYLNMKVTVGGHSASVGAICIWIVCAVLIISFIRGMTN